MTTALRPAEVTRLCDGSQACKRADLVHGKWQVRRHGKHPSWTAERRAEVVVDGETVHEDSAQAEPFNIWEAVTAPPAPDIRWTCEACAATGTMSHSDMLGWDSDATIHQSSHADGPFGAMPKLIISEVAR